MKLQSSFAALVLLTNNLSAQEDTSRKPQRFNLHFQTTYIYQYKPSFRSTYEGPHSLSADNEKQNSVTATLYIGAKLWKGAELYVNPELAGGSGLSGAEGMAGSSNGETFRAGDPSPTLYLARLFLKQTFALGKKTEWEDDNPNQIGEKLPVNRLSFYFGKMSIGDLFDNNEYSNSPRTQFMNWSLMNNGAWDYAANVRGYTYSFTTELVLGKMSYKLSAATLPTEANGSELNTNFSDSFAIAINAEVDKSYSFGSRNGTIRVLAFYNSANMGNYAQAVSGTGTPDVTTTRKFGRTKKGFGINFDQEVNNTLGLFGRFGWNDGKNETWVFAEIDRSVSLGASLKGSGWKRDDDNAGIAIVVNGLSKEHRNYLAKGGSGFMLGDGSLNYAGEIVSELYYSCKPSAKIPLWFTCNYQFAANPGYNKDRSPVHIFSFRMHCEF